MERDWTIHQGDALSVLRTLPSESAHCCVTSPPYFGLRNYNVEGQLGLEATPAEFIGKLVEVFEEVRRVLRSDGTLWLNMGDSYANDEKWGGSGSGPTSKNYTSGKGGYAGQRVKRKTGFKPKDLMMMPHRLAIALQDAGWWVRMDMPWDKGNGMPESVTDRPTKSHEYIFLLAKSPRYFYDIDAVREKTGKEADPEWYEAEKARLKGWTGEDNTGAMARQPKAAHGNFNHPNGRNLRSVWRINTEAFPESHFAVFPPELPMRCILAGTSAKGCCSVCGAPWVRQVEKMRTPTRPGNSSCQDGTKEFFQAKGSGGNSELRYRILTETKTIGWSPSCACEQAYCSTCNIVIECLHGTQNRTKQHKDVPKMRRDIPRRQSEEEILFSDVLRDECEGATKSRLRNVQKVISTEKPQGPVLQHQVLESGDRKEPEEFEGLVPEQSRIHPDLPSESSDGIQSGICNGAPISDGRTLGENSASTGSRTSHQRKKERQPDRKSGVDAESRARQEAERQANGDLPLLQNGVSGSRKCPSCNNPLESRTPPVEPCVILDPFCGSGTTLMVARQLGRRGIGIELNPDYLAMAERRVENALRVGLKRQRPNADQLPLLEEGVA